MTTGQNEPRVLVIEGVEVFLSSGAVARYDMLTEWERGVFQSAIRLLVTTPERVPRYVAPQDARAARPEAAFIPWPPLLIGFSPNRTRLEIASIFRLQDPLELP